MWYLERKGKGQFCPSGATMYIPLLFTSVDIGSCPMDLIGDGQEDSGQVVHILQSSNSENITFLISLQLVNLGHAYLGDINLKLSCLWIGRKQRERKFIIVFSSQSE